MYIPSRTDAFFSHPFVMSQLYARINMIIAPGIFDKGKGEFSIQEKSSFQVRFSDIIFYLGSLAALFFGFDTLRNKNHLKSLTSRASPLNVYIAIVVTRLLILDICFDILFGGGIIMAMGSGLKFTVNDMGVVIPGYFLAGMLMLFFCFLVGMIIGFIRSKGIGFAAIIGAWILLILILPAISGSLTEKEITGWPSFVKLEKQNLEAADNIERLLMKDKSTPDETSVEQKRKGIESFWNNEFRQLTVLEKTFRERIALETGGYRKMSLLTPVTFYHLTSNEAASRGHAGFLAFYDYLRKIKSQFVRFWIDRKFYSGQKELANFIKGNENLFYTKSGLPDGFAAGIAINIGTILILCIICYFLYKGYLLRNQGRGEPM
jgi:hypothetical protein